MGTTTVFPGMSTQMQPMISRCGHYWTLPPQIHQSNESLTSHWTNGRARILRIEVASGTRFLAGPGDVALGGSAGSGPREAAGRKVVMEVSSPRNWAAGGAEGYDETVWRARTNKRGFRYYTNLRTGTVCWQVPETPLQLPKAPGGMHGGLESVQVDQGAADENSRREMLVKQGEKVDQGEVLPASSRRPENKISWKEMSPVSAGSAVSVQSAAAQNGETFHQGGQGAATPHQGGQGAATSKRTGPEISGDAEDNLPAEGWLALYDPDSGYPYFFHPETGRSEWTLPEWCHVVESNGQISHSSSSESYRYHSRLELPSGWQEATDDDGNTYFFNEYTGEWSWEVPTSGGASTAQNQLYDVDLNQITGTGPGVARFGASSGSSSGSASDSGTDSDADSVSSRSSGSSLGAEGVAALDKFQRTDGDDSKIRSKDFEDPEDGGRRAERKRRRAERRRRRKRNMSITEVVHDSLLVAKRRASAALGALQPQAHTLVESTVAVGKSVYAASAHLATKAVRYLTGAHTNESAQKVFQGPRSIDPASLEGQTGSNAVGRHVKIPGTTESGNVFREAELSVPSRISHTRRQIGARGRELLSLDQNRGRPVFMRVDGANANANSSPARQDHQRLESQELSPVERQALRKSLSVSGGHWPQSGLMSGPQDAPPVVEPLHLCKAEEEAIKAMIEANSKFQVSSGTKAMDEMSKMLIS